jgi:hypothetical protein
MASSGARLEVVRGNAAGTSLLVEDELVLGRQIDGVGALAGDDEISRSHARVSLDAAGFCAIEDLGSTNGTFVNGLRISGPQTLAEGDTIEVGATTLVVRELPACGSDQTSITIVPREGPAPQPPFSIQLEVDFATREAILRLDDESDPVRLVLDAGRWRAISTDSEEHG